MTVQPTGHPPMTRRRRLPFPLLVLAFLMLLKALLLIAVVAGATLNYLQPAALGDLLSLELPPEDVEAIQDMAVAGAFVVVAAVLVIVSVIGLLLRKRSGWLLAMVLTGLFIAIDIYNSFNGGANHFWMLLNIVSVLYLNQQVVREVVGAADVGSPPGDPPPVVHA